MARTLFKDGPRGLGDLWEPLLDAFVRMARPGTEDRANDVDAFFERIDAARRRCHRRSLDPILQALAQCRAHADELVAAIEHPNAPFRAVLDPHIALLPDNLRYWYRELGRPYRLLHDEHIVFTPQMVRSTMIPLASVRPHPSLPRMGKAVLHLFGTGSSEAHPSIQLADLVAGAGRTVTSDFLTGVSTLPDGLTAAVTPLVRLGLLPDDSFWDRPEYFPRLFDAPDEHVRLARCRPHRSGRAEPNTDTNPASILIAVGPWIRTG
ncbi:hypothetical protein ACFYV7_30955 [Nocardia suismassiliense]|uniref:Uncharacterized protein n=1 Tax=Nocardia suismassiliense TaxID=2077092 RepID=A0ABW6R164_9NOCA